jgi:bifunctional DNase/RNase
MSIYGVSFDIGAKQPIVLLKTVNDNKFLPIWIGSTEATAILMKLQGVDTPRPMTHDLLSSVVTGLDAEIARITVTDLRENTFFALITLRMRTGEIEIDSRPSDALALAVRAGAPIFVADRVIEESALSISEGQLGETEDVVEAFKAFLDEVNPEDFAG